MRERNFGGRTLARSQALQLLFQAEATDRTVAEVLDGPYALSQSEPLDEFAERLALGADDMRHDLDALIGATSTNWAVGRMPSVDRNLLRLALYEMLCVDEVAIAVTIDETVELAKAYGTDESSRFVNGLLGRVARRMDAGVDVVGQALAFMGEDEDADEFAAEDEELAEEDVTEAEAPAADDLADDAENTLAALAAEDDEFEADELDADEGEDA